MQRATSWSPGLEPNRYSLDDWGKEIFWGVCNLQYSSCGVHAQGNTKGQSTLLRSTSLYTIKLIQDKNSITFMTRTKMNDFWNIHRCIVIIVYNPSPRCWYSRIFPKGPPEFNIGVSQVKFCCENECKQGASAGVGLVPLGAEALPTTPVNILPLRSCIDND